MKKILSIVAIVALFATSCVKSELDNVQVVPGGEEVVTLTLQTPNLGSRAIAEGDKATDLHYAVYDENWNVLIVEKTGIDISTTIKVRLVKNKEYNFVFWAQSPNAGCYTLNLGAVGDSDVTPSIDVDYTNANANDDHRDAFFGQKNLTVNGTVNETVYLKRPFAQVNFGTNDAAKAKAAGYDIRANGVTTKFTTRAYTSLNLATGVATGETDVTFVAAALPEVKTFTTTLGTHDWLAMNYILWPDAADLSLSTCKMEIAVPNQETIVIEYPMAPARRNYRTNLVGSLLTEEGDIEVIILPATDGDYDKQVVNVTNGASLQAAINEAGSTPTTIVLTENIVLGPGVVLGSTASTLSRATAVAQDITLNLNGMTITAEIPDVTANTAIFHVKKGQKLTIEGEGTVNCTFNKAINCSALLINNDAGEVVINGGTYTLNAPASWTDCLNPLFVDTNSNVGAATTTINGGTFNWTRNLFRNFSQQNAAVPAKLVINGGVFNAREDDWGNIWNQKPSANRPAGAGVIEIHGGEFNYVKLCSGWSAEESIVCDAENLYLKPAGEDGEWYYELAPAVSVSSIDNLAATIEQAKADNIEMVKVVGQLGITEDTTLDLAGVKLVAEDNFELFKVEEGAKLTISNADLTAFSSPIWNAGGELVIESGVYTQTGKSVGSPSTYRYCIKTSDNGTTIINGGEFDSHNGLFDAGANVVINGGTFHNNIDYSATRHMAYVSGTGSLTINGGTFHNIASSPAGGECICIYTSTGYVAINGGYFTSLWSGSGNTNSIITHYASGSTVEITGGYFNTNKGIASFVEENTDDATKAQYPYVAK